MLLINVTGCNGRKAALLKRAAEFAFYTLMPRVQNFVGIDIVVEENLDVSAYEVMIGEREIEITINKEETGDDLLTAVFHEVVHVVQDLRRWKRELSDGRMMWFNEDHTKTTYYNQPWEKQAYELQEEILEKWQKN